MLELPLHKCLILVLTGLAAGFLRDVSCFSFTGVGFLEPFIVIQRINDPTGSTPNRQASKRLWGVSLHKEKRKLMPDAPELASWGEPFETTTTPFYSVQATFLGKNRYVGIRPTPQSAGELYDSALYFLWGFMKRPKPRFNSLRPGDPAPELLPEVKRLQDKLRAECARSGLDFEAFNYTFAEREIPQ
jgi:hypothetical protein